MAGELLIAVFVDYENLLAGNSKKRFPTGNPATANPSEGPNYYDQSYKTVVPPGTQKRGWRNTSTPRPVRPRGEVPP